MTNGDLVALAEEMEAYAETKRPGSMVGKWAKRLRAAIQEEARCVASNYDGDPCQKAAGHAGPHSV